MVSVGAKYGSGGRRPGLRRYSACGLRAVATSNEWIHRSSWASIITAVRGGGGEQPEQCPSTPTTSASSPLVGLGCEAGEHVLEGLVEAGDTLVLQGKADVVHVDSGGGQAAHHLVCVRYARVDGAGQGAVVLEGGDRGLGQGVDGVGADELVDVQGSRRAGAGMPRRPVPSEPAAKPGSLRAWYQERR